MRHLRDKNLNMYQGAVMVPIGDWAKVRLASLSGTDRIRDESRVGSGFGKNVSNWVGRDLVYPNNVIHMATECCNRSNSATFPVDLPAWFIQLFTQPAEVVLDPFIGSGTTALAAVRLGRRFVGIDTNREYVEEAQRRISATQVRLPSISERRAAFSPARQDRQARATQ